ncbi:MAG: M48 family metalloprotease [Holophagales bacterium]|nr:M48 family metalloprotease [Holophagales bacterium]
MLATPRRFLTSTLAASALLLAATGCATNPATGKSQLNFYSEAQEIAMGREADAEITASLGLVDDPELQAYVSDLGRRLAAKSERPNLPWSFKVVDDPVVNAFALPGGFIYVTRGILGHMRSEAELASVLGHEIGHVTAQHSVNQLSKQQLAMGGLVVGMIAVPEIGNLGDLAASGLGLLFLKYGRDDERQADDLGLRYMATTGFETREMPKMFGVLQGVGEIAGGGGRIPNWLSTHPDPGARRERSTRLIAERHYPPGEVGTDRLLNETEGLVFGADPREGYFEGSTFYHPQLAFRIEFPEGWKSANTKSSVEAVHPDKIALLELTLAKERSASEAADAFLRQDGLTPGRTSSDRVHGLSTVSAQFDVPRQSGEPLAGRAVFVELDGRVLRFLGLALGDRVNDVRRTLLDAQGSVSRLTDRSKLDVEPQRVAVVELPRAMSFEEFLERYPSDADPRVLALINGVDDPAATLPAGRRLKRIEGKRYGG